nr:MAG TPA: hypothetical protein [Caudoviricetes sp.]
MYNGTFNLFLYLYILYCYIIYINIKIKRAVFLLPYYFYLDFSTKKICGSLIPS